MTVFGGGQPGCLWAEAHRDSSSSEQTLKLQHGLNFSSQLNKLGINFNNCIYERADPLLSVLPPNSYLIGVIHIYCSSWSFPFHFNLHICTIKINAVTRTVKVVGSNFNLLVTTKDQLQVEKREIGTSSMCANGTICGFHYHSFPRSALATWIHININYATCISLGIIRISTEPSLFHLLHNLRALTAGNPPAAPRGVCFAFSLGNELFEYASFILLRVI